MRQLGDEGQHLRLKLRDGPAVWDAIGFGIGGRAPRVQSEVDLVYRLSRDSRSHSGTLQLEILDLDPVLG